MDWDKLRIFYAVAQAGSFTHAGENLNLSQSAVSRQISTLEESIGVPLFHRHARGLALTEEGEILQDTARDIFSKLSAVEGRLADSRQSPEGPLRITVAGFVGVTWLAPLIAGLHQEHPYIRFSLLMDNRIYNLSMREADAAIRLYKPEQPSLIQKHLTSIDFQICAAPDYLKKNGAPSELEDLKNHTLLGYPEDAVVPFTDPNWLLRMAQTDPEQNSKVLLMNSIYAIYRAVESGAGIAALPAYLIRESQNLEVVSIKDAVPPPIDMYFVYPEERRHSPRIKIFRDFLIREIAENGLRANTV